MYENNGDMFIKLLRRNWQVKCNDSRLSKIQIT